MKDSLCCVFRKSSKEAREEVEKLMEMTRQRIAGKFVNTRVKKERNEVVFY